MDWMSWSVSPSQDAVATSSTKIFGASCHGSCETHELSLSHGQVTLGDLEVQTVGVQKARQVGLSSHVHELVVGVLVEHLEKQPHGALQNEQRQPNDGNLGPEVLEAKVGMTTLSMRI